MDYINSACGTFNILHAFSQFMAIVLENIYIFRSDIRNYFIKTLSGLIVSYEYDSHSVCTGHIGSERSLLLGHNAIFL